MGKAFSLAGLLLLASIFPSWAQWDFRDGLGVSGVRVSSIDGTPDGADGLTSIHDMTVNTDGIFDFLREFKEKALAGRDVFTVAEANGV